MAFRKGQKVVCIKTNAWQWNAGPVVEINPKYEEILIIDEVRCDYLTFDKYRNCFGKTVEYAAFNFRPLPPLYTSVGISSQIAKEYIQIKEVVEPVKEKQNADS